jgi:hypothetical protein
MYTVNIPTPSAKRMEQDVRLIIRRISCWEIDEEERRIPSGRSSFEFEWEPPLIVADLDRLDVDYQTIFFIEFRNATGSRKERYLVTPTQG